MSVWLKSKKKMQETYKSFKHKFKQIWAVRKKLLDLNFIEQNFSNQILEQQKNINKIDEKVESAQFKNSVNQLVMMSFNYVFIIHC